MSGPAPVPMSTRAAQVFAYFLTRGDEPFQRYFLSASLRTIKRWATRFRSLRRSVNTGGRPPLDEKVVEIILTLKRENRAWGHWRIREELRRMGIRVSEPTVARILREHGFSPRPGRKLDFERVRSTAKDALWALDYFAVQTAKGVWLQALLVIDVHTREPHLLLFKTMTWRKGRRSGDAFARELLEHAADGVACGPEAREHLLARNRRVLARGIGDRPVEPARLA